MLAVVYGGAVVYICPRGAPAPIRVATLYMFPTWSFYRIPPFGKIGKITRNSPSTPSKGLLLDGARILPGEEGRREDVGG